MGNAGAISLARGKKLPGVGLQPTRLPDRKIRWMLSLVVITLCYSGIELAHAQGTVNFANRVYGTLICYVYGENLCNPVLTLVGNGPNDLPPGTTDWTGFPKLSGSNYLAQLMSAPGADAPDSALQFAVSPPTSFRTGIAAGVLVPTSGILANVPKDAPVATVRMFVWDNTSGFYPDAISGWNAAWGGGTSFGLSTKFNLNAIGGDFNVPPNLMGLVSFCFSSMRSPPRLEIGLQPRSQVADAGSDVTFFVHAVYYLAQPGGPTIPFNGSYQWFFQAAPIAGATNAVLTLSKVQAKDAGEYYARLTDLCVSKVSGTTQLTVTLEVREISGGLNPDGFHLTVLSDPGLAYHVDVSTNLLDWSTLTWITNLLGSNTMVDPWSPGRDRGFYRAVP